ncbi:hypothetical protein ABZP36_027284 [Zizania latifolia]
MFVSQPPPFRLMFHGSSILALLGVLGLRVGALTQILSSSSGGHTPPLRFRGPPDSSPPFLNNLALIILPI